MAIVILGGLLTSTLLSLFIVPSLYLYFGAGAQREPAAETPGSPRLAAERARRFERAPGRRAAAAAHQEGGEGTPPGRREE
jgi:hypothetical protein